LDFLISEACAVSTVSMMVVAAWYEMVEKHATLNYNQRSESLMLAIHLKLNHVCSHVAEFFIFLPMHRFHISHESIMQNHYRLGCHLEGTKQNCKNKHYPLD
jgi:hypothetical protein